MHLRKRNRIQKLHLKRYKKRNRHHLLTKSRGGKDEVDNLLLIDMERHTLLHKLFGNKTIQEIIDLLERVDRAKKRQKVYDD